MNEPRRHPSSPADAVRPQLEAVKGYLGKEGFSDVDDDPKFHRHAIEDQHVIAMLFDGQSRNLRISYQWLSDFSGVDVRDELADLDLSEALRKADAKSFVEITAEGRLSYGRL